MKKDKWFQNREIDKNMKNSGYVDQINYISKKIIENKVILFLGAGFSNNFGLPTWTQLMQKIIIKGKKINEEKNYTEHNKKLDQIKNGLNENKLDLVRILDTILYYIPDLNDTEKQKKFLMDSYKENLSFRKYIIDKDFSKKQEMSLNIRILIDRIFTKIITLNYDDIFAYSDGKQIKNKWKYLDEIITDPNQKYDKWVYPIHGSIVANQNEKKIPIIDTFFSFIENWKNTNFVENFQKLLKKSINDNYIFLFIGCSFSDNFLLNEIAYFIQENGFFNKEETLFLVLWDDIQKKEETYKPDENKFPPLPKGWGSIDFFNLSKFSKNHEIKTDSKSECVTNFFTYIKRNLEIYEKNNTLLNEINNIKFSEIQGKEFNVEKYFKELLFLVENEDKSLLKNLSDKEIIFILSLYEQKKYLLQQIKKDSFQTLYFKYIKILWEFIINNKRDSDEIITFIKNSGIFIDILDWAQTHPDPGILLKIGEFYNV